MKKIPGWLKQFGELWRAAMVRSMAVTGHGYHRPSMRHSGRGTDRRPDKLSSNVSKFWRSYQKRYG